MAEAEPAGSWLAATERQPRLCRPDHGRHVGRAGWPLGGWTQRCHLSSPRRPPHTPGLASSARPVGRRSVPVASSSARCRRSAGGHGGDGVYDRGELFTQSVSLVIR